MIRQEQSAKFRGILIAGILVCGQCVLSQGLAADTDDPKPKKGPDCVYVPTPHDIVEKMLEMANVQKDDVVYDLGCGDGRIVVQAAKKRGCRGVGFEIVPELAQQARENAKQNGVERLVTIKEEDLFEADMKEATVLPMYLLPKMLAELKPKLAKLKPGTRIISHDYRIKDVIPDKVETLTSKETGAEHILILYTLPLHEQVSESAKDAE
ncbi:MAG: SAM-dependent methyltransferase [Pirellulaceae bacterium]